MPPSKGYLAKAKLFYGDFIAILIRRVGEMHEQRYTRHIVSKQSRTLDTIPSVNKAFRVDNAFTREDWILR